MNSPSAQGSPSRIATTSAASPSARTRSRSRQLRAPAFLDVPLARPLTSLLHTSHLTDASPPALAPLGPGARRHVRGARAGHHSAPHHEPSAESQLHAFELLGAEPLEPQSPPPRRRPRRSHAPSPLGDGDHAQEVAQQR